jgi:NTP pyrophosphatase (non-canonical NTP hydrolase)
LHAIGVVSFPYTKQIPLSLGRHDRKPIAEFLSKTFKCTHGIKFRSRGTGKRSRHIQRDIGCPFHIYATALEDAGPLGYRVKVRTHDTHNHVIGPDASKSVGALHEAAEYEYAEVTPAGSDAAATAAAAAVGVGAHAHVASPPSGGDLQLHHMSAFAHAASQLHHHHHHDGHASLHDHANATDILGPSDGNDGESLLAEGVIDSHLADFSTAAEAVAAAAAAVAATLPESAAASASSSTTAATAATSRFEATATLEELRRKLSQFADDRDWDQFHSPRNLLLALAGEMGELCECFQWKGDNKPVNGAWAGNLIGARLGKAKNLCAGYVWTEWTTEERVHLGEEISDVMMYLIRLAGAWSFVLGS